MTRLGVVFTADRPPEELAAFATAAEAAGLDDLWLWEDCFLAGGIATSATALAATTRMTVGLGVMPAVFRNPVAAAMEIATLARLHPGRFVAGLGHGVPAWMDQVGALPPRPVRALEETAVAIRRLLAGERFSTRGRPRQPPRRLPRTTTLVATAGGSRRASPPRPTCLRSQRRRDDPRRAVRAGLHPLGAQAHRRRPSLRRPHRPTSRHRLRQGSPRRRPGACSRDRRGHAAQRERRRAARATRSRGGARRASRVRRPRQGGPSIPDDLVDQLTATGTAEQVIASLRAIAETGVDTIVLAPIGPDPDEQLRLLADSILPELHG